MAVVVGELMLVVDHAGPRVLVVVAVEVAVKEAMPITPALMQMEVVAAVQRVTLVMAVMVIAAALNLQHVAVAVAAQVVAMHVIAVAAVLEEKAAMVEV